MKYRKKPVVIEAIQFTGLKSINQMTNLWAGPFLDVADFDYAEEKNNFFIETPEGTHCAMKGDWIIKGVKGEFYPVKPGVFELSYERVDE